MAPGLRLKEVKIRGFRGYGELEKTLDLTAPVTIIFGGNRSGKSSTLNALEWALYGKEVTGKGATGIVERKRGWLVVNRKCPSARVELTMSSEEGEIVVARESGRTGKKKEETFSFVDEKGRDYREDVDLWKFLGLEARDFMSLVYLHQEVIRDIVVSDPSVRRAALDRLLGVSDLRALFESLKRIRAKDYERRTEEIYRELERELGARSKSYQEQAENLRGRGIQKGLREEDFTEEMLVGLSDEVVNLLDSLAQRADIGVPEIKPLRDPEAYEDFKEEAKRIIHRLRSENPGAVSQRELMDLRERLSTAMAEYESKTQALKDLRKEKTELEKQGDLKALQALRNEYGAKRREIGERLKKINARLPVIAATIDYLSELEDKRSRIPCPACEQEIFPEELLERLRAVQEEIGEEGQALEKESRDLSEKARKLEKDIRHLEELVERKIPEAEEEERSLRESIGELLGITVTDADDARKLARDNLAEIEKGLEEARKVLERYNEDILSVEETLERAGIVHGVLEAERRIENIRTISDSPEWKSMNQARDRLNRMLDAVDRSRGAMEAVLKEKVRERLEEAEGRIKEYYRMLVERPDFESITIDPEDNEVYASSDGDAEKVVNFFNQGDMNCAALSIFLALGGGASHEYGPSFVILDDPSQSLDVEQKRRLARLIDKVASERQVLLATMDGELLQALQDEVAKAKVIYRLGEWGPQNGPSIVRE